ncbi:MAG: SRPBCC domain-containing protein [Bauldia sp.]
MSEPLYKEVFIAAPPEEVFPYFTDPEKYLRWMGVAVRIDARPRGRFQVDPNGREIIAGEYLEVSFPKRIVFTWGWREPPDHPMREGSSRVEIDLIAQDGGTLLRLTHFDIATSRREEHETGWSYHLARLEKAAAGHDPGPDACVANLAPRRGSLPT